MREDFNLFLFARFCTKMIVLVGALSCIGICGCQPPTPATQPATTEPIAVDDPPPAPTTQSTWAQAPPVVDVAFLQCLVPEGAVSRNDSFWQKLQEPVVDDDLNDTLNRNGVRVAEGSVDHWNDLVKILAKAGAVINRGNFASPKPENQEIPIGGEHVEETLFLFDNHGLTGTYYEHCVNVLGFTYGPAPLERGVAHLELTPIVRSARRHYEYTQLNNEYEIHFVSTDHLYNLGLSVDLHEGKFLVIAPSRQSERTTSIGHQFLTSDANAGRRELVYLILANPTHLIEPATQPAK